MGIDWDRLCNAPVFAAFGESARIAYAIAGGSTFTVDGVFDEGASPVTLDGVSPPVNEVRPVLGIRLAQFPADFNVRNAKGDTFTVTRAGVATTYRVKDGRPDGKGWALLEATKA